MKLKMLDTMKLLPQIWMVKVMEVKKMETTEVRRFIWNR